jgi:glycosyltransferase involved in cell wall biosynthesis
MHVAQISFFVDPQRRVPAQLLEAWHSLGDVAAAAASQGVRVTVVQASEIEGRIERDGVSFHFVAPRRVPEVVNCADVCHVHGLGFSSEVRALRTCVPRPSILLQDHAGRPPHLWRRAAFRAGLSVADGIAFCTRAQAAPFASLIAKHTRIFEIPESTSTFTPGPRGAARAATGIHGDPAVLWVGHLDRNKDPLTVLEGIARAAQDLPGIRLWCCYGMAPLAERVEATIRQHPLLRGRVELLGRVPHESVQDLMRAADLFVLGSHREGCNFSTIEALATGLTPVVTDIPSMRALTGEGAVGALWKAGDAAGCAAALRRCAAVPDADRRRAAYAHFDTHLSFTALGRRLVAAYEQIATARAVAGLRREAVT